jgi:hypothetical protein
VHAAQKCGQNARIVPIFKTRIMLLKLPGRGCKRAVKKLQPQFPVEPVSLAVLRVAFDILDVRNAEEEGLDTPDPRFQDKFVCLTFSELSRCSTSLTFCLTISLALNIPERGAWMDDSGNDSESEPAETSDDRRRAPPPILDAPAPKRRRVDEEHRYVPVRVTHLDKMKRQKKKATEKVAENRYIITEEVKNRVLAHHKLYRRGWNAWTRSDTQLFWRSLRNNPTPRWTQHLNWCRDMKPHSKRFKKRKWWHLKQRANFLARKLKRIFGIRAEWMP